MRSLSKRLFWLVVFLVSAVPLAMGATISGSVKGPGGAPFEGAFVEAQNTATSIMTDVLSQENGSYTIPNLAAGTYRVSIRAVGYKAAAQSETLQTADQHAKADFALAKGAVSWSDLSVWQAQVLLPDGPGKNLLFGQPGKNAGPCFACHDFQSRMATRRLDHQGWLGLVNYMRQDAVPYFIGPYGAFPFTNQTANEAADYLNQVFGLNSTTPASPADLPGYGATVRKFGNQAMNIVYVVYPLTDPTWLSFQVYPPTIQKGLSSDGSIWVGDYGNANRVVRVNPETGENTTYNVPCPSAAGIHSAEVGPQGYVWFAEQGCNRVGRIDVKTGKVTQFQDPYVPGKEWGLRGGSKHDAHPMMVDGKLYVFASGDPATRLDPATGKFTAIPGIPNTYDVYGDLVNGNVWFTDIGKGPLREVDPKTLKTVLSFAPSVDPTDFKSHRISITPKGVVWVTCRGDRICSLDPKTKAFKQYTPLGPNKADYAIQVDRAGHVWWSMSDLDTLQRLDPKTGKIVEYPFPSPEITMRKFWLDAQGRIWWASPANATVGYFYLAGGGMHTDK
ncbi:MAG TPA: carboxypeptidase regulatory-like domain-containing protein [Patescibacteria group bacterium]|nr:carboxypeptidase regulatory-like domain-containing protein [Patescibacteria group bacterium]